MSSTGVVWVGAESLRPLLAPVSECEPHPDNPRRGNLDVIEESLRTYGQVRPILRNERTGRIVAGNHTWRAAVDRLGWTHVAVVDANLDDEEERGYLLMDNRSSDLGAYDNEILTGLLQSLAEAGRLAGTGYDEAAVEKLVADADRTAAAVRDREPEPPDSDRPPLDAMREVHLEFSAEARKRFDGYLKMLAKEYGTNGPSETVFRCVEQAAKAL